MKLNAKHSLALKNQWHKIANTTIMFRIFVFVQNTAWAISKVVGAPFVACDYESITMMQKLSPLSGS